MAGLLNIECRVNAENPAKNFMPSPGQVDMYLPPGGFGVRIDSAVYPGYTISPSMILWSQKLLFGERILRKRFKK